MQGKMVFHNESEMDKYVNKMMLFTKVYITRRDSDTKKMSHGGASHPVQMICEMACRLSSDDLKKVIAKVKELLDFAQQDIHNGRRSSAYIDECYDTRVACMRLLGVCHNVLLNMDESENVK